MGGIFSWTSEASVYLVSGGCSKWWAKAHQQIKLPVESLKDICPRRPLLVYQKLYGYKLLLSWCRNT